MSISASKTAKTILILAALLFLWDLPAGAQRGKWISHVNPSMISEIILKDEELFVASSGGLIIFQPRDSTFEQFTNTIGLPSNLLTCLAFDAGGALYVGTDQAGIARLDFVPGGFAVNTLSSTFDGLADDRITTLTAWGDSIAYGTMRGAGLIVEGFPGPRFLVKDGLPSEFIDDLFADGDRLWFATDNGVARLDKFGFITEFSTGLPSVNTHVFARDDTALWVGTEAGVARFNPSDSTWIPDGLGNQSIFSLKYDGQKLWAASRVSLFDNDGSGWAGRSFFDVYQRNFLTIAFSEVRGLQPMSDGTVYLGVRQLNQRIGAYLMVFDGTRVREFPNNAPPENHLVRATFDIDGSLWVSSRRLGVSKLTPSGVWFAYNPAAGDTNLSSQFDNFTLLADSQGSKWFSTLWRPGFPVPMDELQDGIDLSRDNDVWIHHTIGSGGGDGLGSLRNQRALEDPAGNRWFLSDIEEGTSPLGWWGINILSADRSEWKQVNPANTSLGMPVGNITDVAFGPDGVVWVADKVFGVIEWLTGGYDQANLFDLSDDIWITRGTVSGNFDSKNVTALALRSDGVLWVGTELGVFKLDNGVFRNIRANRGLGVGLLSNNVFDILLDRDENLWVATELGLDRIARDDDNDITSFTTGVVWQTQLSLFFPPDVVSPLTGARCEAFALHPTRDLLYIATLGGLSILDLSSLEPTALDLSTVFVFPNPIRTRRGHGALKIANHNRPVDVEIYTLEGELVHRARNVGASQDVVWELTTEAGFLAASGVYLVRIRSGGDSIVRRVSLIR
ncbi:MAG: T9SS type A sorting domain-containing protein [Candidatus Krumholzibacteria bacterium]|nr:T9SS type A sorting domain-containing protein [Candidatus Krumholzibacteria bacterium]